MKNLCLPTLLMLLTLLIWGVTFAQDCELGQAIEHELGTSCVPDNVVRVITLEHAMTEAVVTLGVEPVGAADVALFNLLVNPDIPLGENITDVGSRREPNLELIAQLNPDLIIGASWRMGSNYEELNAIAPTLAFLGSESLELMADFFTKIAISLNQEAEAERHLATMEQAFTDATEVIAASNISKNFVLSQTWYEDDLATFRMFTNNSMPAEILGRIGLTNTWAVDFEANGFSVVGIEALGALQDTNFLYLTDPDSAPFYAESALWNSLPVVEAGSAYRLSDNLWLFGGPLSAVRFVDAVLASLNVQP